MTVNALIAAIVALFAYAHVIAFLRQPRLSLALIVLVEIAIATMFLVRSPSRRTSTSVWDWATAVAGTAFPLLLRPVADAIDSTVGQVLQCSGTALAFASVLALNRSFGIVPADRGLRATGAYGIVRHPLYAAYTVSNVGYLLSNSSMENALIVGVSVVLQIVRIHNEERILSVSPEYGAYKSRTRWRVIPGVY